MTWRVWKTDEGERDLTAQAKRKGDPPNPPASSVVAICDCGAYVRVDLELVEG